jgi:hypothetical protein
MSHRSVPAARRQRAHKLADEGKITGFTGVDDPYEEPEHAELIVETSKESIGESVGRIFAKLEELAFWSPRNRPKKPPSSASAWPPSATCRPLSTPWRDVSGGRGLHAWRPPPDCLHDRSAATRERGKPCTTDSLPPRREPYHQMAKERAALAERAACSQLVVGSRQLADLEMLAIGAYSPLAGFMNQADYSGAASPRCTSPTASGQHLSRSRPSEQAARLHEGSSSPGHCPGSAAVMTIEEKFGYTKSLRPGTSIATSERPIRA